LRKLARQLPQYDYLYLGDTKNLPYGNKSQAQIYKLAVRTVEHMFKQDCALVVIACNTVSSEALRKLQQDYLPHSRFKGRKILGIIRPTVETIGNIRRVGLIGTRQTVASGAYRRELENIDPDVKLFAVATPALVDLIEAQRLNRTVEPLKIYLRPLIANRIQALILGCTHYGLIRKQIRAGLPKNVKIIAQEDLLSGKLESYLKRHPEIQSQLGKSGKIILEVTKLNPGYSKLAKKWFGKHVHLSASNNR